MQTWQHRQVITTTTATTTTTTTTTAATTTTTTTATTTTTTTTTSVAIVLCVVCGRKPCWLSPFHYRFDWLLWFAAFQNYQQSYWIVAFVDQILLGDPHDIVVPLLAFNGDPFRELKREQDLSKNNTKVGRQQTNVAYGQGLLESDETMSTVPTFVRIQLYEVLSLPLSLSLSLPLTLSL